MKDDRILDFSSFIADRTRDFTGREWVFAEIDRWLADPDGPSFFIITGVPGIGKSAIAARLTQIRNLAAYHFCIARDAGSIDPALFARSLAHQLCRIDGFALGILKDSSVDLKITQNIQANYGQAIGTKIENLVVNAPSGAAAFTHAVLQPLRVLCDDGYQGQVVLLVDALDEAVQHRGAETIVDLLANTSPLPRQVRFVLTSRPEGAALEQFEQRRVPYFVPDAGRPENLQDIRLFVRGQLAAKADLRARLAENGMAEDPFVERVTGASGGNFLYVVWLLPAIAAGSQRFDRLEALPQGLDGIYREFLRTRTVGESTRQWRFYRPLLGVLAAAQEPLSEQQLTRFTGLSDQDVHDMLADSRQFLDPKAAEQGRYQFYHQSVIDFLVDKDRAGGFWIDPATWHERILASYRGQAVSWNQVDWHAVDDYGLRHIPSHLIQAQTRSDLVAVMTDLTFIAAKCTAGLVDDLLRDFEASRAALDAEWDEATVIAHFSRFVRYTAHLLRASPQLCYQEAYNSAQWHISQAAINLLRSAGFPTVPWLRKTAGTARQHHSGQVISMAFWGDDRYLAVSTAEREVWVWDTIQGALWYRCETPPSAAKSLAVSPDGKLLAAGFGAADPSPFAAGVVVWARNGNVQRSYPLEDWVYTVRWRSSDELLIGAGLPTGSEAVGRLFRATVTGATCDEIGRCLADRPIVLTWDPLPAQPDQIMTLSMDGVVCHLTPDYIPPTPDELSEISHQLMADGDYDAYDARLAERRPISHRLNAPCVDELGFRTAAQSFGQNTICMLGEPSVPPELFAWRSPDPDGIYFYDLGRGRQRSIPFNTEARSAGFKATCLAATSRDRCIAIGTSHGQVYLHRDAGDRIKPELVHQGRFPVTAVCFSSSGERVAVGDAGAELAVYNRMDRSLVFKTGWAERPITARVKDSQAILLYGNRLEWCSTSGKERGGTLPLMDGLRGLDFDYCGSLGVVLCTPDAGEEAGGRRTILIVDLAARQVVLRAEIPPRVPGPPQDAMTSEMASYVNTVRIYVDDVECRLVLGSAQGLVSYPLLAFEQGRVFVLPESEVKRQREMTVIRLGLHLPEISCEVFALASEQAAVVCGYADNADHPNISGEMRVWDLAATRYSAPQSFSSAVRVLESTDQGVFIVGTEHGEASSWRFDGAWQRLAGTQHPVAVVAVAYSPEERLVCSASRDGLIMVWRFLGGIPLLKTCVDVEPICVGFLQHGRSICMIDREGEAHIWEIEGLDALFHGERQVGEKAATEQASIFIQQCLHGAAYLSRVLELSERGEPDAARALLDALPDMPNGREVQQYWQVRLSKKLDEITDVKAANLQGRSSARNRKRSRRKP